MKSVFQLAANLPLAMALVVITLSLTAIVSQYPGSITIDWGREGGSFSIIGTPKN